MAKFDLIVADPCWSFSDKLKMEDVKRSAESQYSVMSDEDIKNLKVKEIASDDSVLVLWVPSSKLQIGLDTMSSWGFDQTQTFIWVKTKKKENFFSDLKKDLKTKIKDLDLKSFCDEVSRFIEDYDYVIDFNDVLNFYMGRIFRQTHEIALVGKRGSPYKYLKDKSQRSVILDVNIKHSAKPDGLQDRLDLMFPTFSKVELFARRLRLGWVCIGNESPLTLNEDIRKSIDDLINMPD